MIGIYSITNKINNKRYIGQSSDILNRFSQHRHNLNKNRHANQHLQAAWNKYSSSAFEFSILEECPEKVLNAREQFWINYYNSYKNGYNLNLGGDGIRGYKHTKDEISRMRKIQSPIPVLQFDFNFNFIKEFEGGVSHAAKELGYTRECIKRCCEHKGKQIFYKNCYWVYKQEYEDSNFTWSGYLAQKRLLQNIKKHQHNNIRKICQYDLSRNLIKIWDSYSDIEEAGFTRNQVNIICNHRKNKKNHKGFIWAYEDYDFSDGYFDSLDTYFNKANEARKKSVIVYDFILNKKMYFDSLSDAVKALNLGTFLPYSAIKNKNMSLGYFWSYANNCWFEKYDKEYFLKCYEKYIKNIPKKTAKCNDNWEILQVFDSQTLAAKSVDGLIANIWRAVHTKGFYKNYHWKYIE